MNRILLFLLLFVAIGISSCKKENENRELLVGKWKVTKLIRNGENALQSDEDYKTSMKLEFSNAGSVLFEITVVDFSTQPPSEDNAFLTATYTWTGDNTLEMGYTLNGQKTSVTGTAEVTESRLIFNTTDGNKDFIEILEAEKL